MMLDATKTPLLDIRGLNVCNKAGKQIIRDLSFTVGRGEIVAVIGESGSGKSVSALASTGLLPPALEVTGGAVQFQGEDLLAASDARMNQVRGGEIGMLFQQPKAMLDPSSRVGAQIAEPLQQHRGMSRREAAREAIALLESVGIPLPERRVRAYAHELSGGMAQRVMIAMALAGQPKLLIADEPTTALDMLVQMQILKLLLEKKRAYDLSILLITHDFSVVSAMADRVVVMYGGRLMEEGSTEEVMTAPKHPYTQALCQCSLMEADKDGTLLSIAGSADRSVEDVWAACIATSEEA